MITDPDGKPYAHNAEQAEAHKLARAEGDGPVSNNTARAYLNAIAADKTAELATLTAERDQLNEMFHQIRLKLTGAGGDPYKLHDEALDGIISERDQLRAATKACEACDEPTAFEVRQLRARAERAEAAETVALVKWNGALERAMKAEADLAALEQCHDDNCRALVKIAAELATERARLDASTILLTVAGERVWHSGVDLRAAIDAGMKEGEK